MLTRVLGIATGLVLVGEGLYAAVNPKGWSEHAAQFAEDYSCCEPMKAGCLELTRLSPDTIRMLAVWEVGIGCLMLRLARR